MSDKKKVNIDSDVIFDSIVDNAVEFISRASKNLKEGDLKYAVLNFYSGAELLIKSRLVKEHWSLMLKSPEKASLDKLKTGDIQTVGLVDGVKRIQELTGISISKSALHSFQELRNHRNRLAHFHHPEIAKIPEGSISKPGLRFLYKDKSKNIEFVKELPEAITHIFVAWYHLHALLTNNWKSHYGTASHKLRLIDYSMKSLTPYLKQKFDSIKLDLDSLKESGSEIVICSNCNFDAAIEDPSTFGTPLRVFKCKLCDMTDSWFEIKCQESDCDGIHAVYSGSCEECDTCKVEIDLAKVIEILTPNIHPGDIDSVESYFCRECESFELGDTSVYQVPDIDNYMCLLCNTVFEVEDLNQCEFCNHPIAGSDDETFLFGCGVCEGSISRF